MNVNDFASQEGDSDSTATAVAEPNRQNLAVLVISVTSSQWFSYLVGGFKPSQKDLGRLGISIQGNIW